MGYTSYTANISAIKIISDKVKKANPSIKQVVGGVHATLDSDILDTLTSVDYSIQREGGSFSCFGRKQNPQHILRNKGGLLFKTGIAPVIKDIDSLNFREINFGIPQEEWKK